uniref:Uncharacterized protein n=2 Tax=Kalmanozyma brasiliensis (strain GHG001) TaxID=1365824 RepID=V5EV80_KALBG
MAAVEATRARFFAQQTGSRSAPRTRPTPTGSTRVSSESRIRTHKPTGLSSSTYRQSFFERCQRAMSQSRSIAREQQVSTFRTGTDAFTRGVLSDDMDVEDDDESLGIPSSPPADDREEDDELTRRRILAEYARLKRIYELKGQLEIGWIDPDQLSWLEEQVRVQEEDVDPHWAMADEQLEQLWLESQSQGGSGDVEMREDEFDDDREFEEALAMLPV